MLRPVRKVLGLRLGAEDGEIGRVADIYFDDEKWAVRYLVADTGTWLPGRLVLISPASLAGVDEGAGVVNVSLRKGHIEAAPSIDKAKPVLRQHEADYAQHYGWPMYWYGPALWGETPHPVYDRSVSSRRRGVEGATGETADPHLRSFSEVSGYHIKTLDEQIGHLDDLIIDDIDWAIRYVTVDTGNWLPGRTILLAPEWIREVSWDRSQLVVGLGGDALRNAPEYDSSEPISREYEAALFKHYRREGYWARRREMPLV